MTAGRLTPARRRQLTREAMLDAAEEVFAKKGVDGAAMDEIATEAGFSRAAVYATFGNKDELLLAVLDRHIARQIEAFSSLSVPDNAVAGAAEAAKVFLGTVRPDVVPLELELRTNALRNPAVRQRLVEADRQIGETLGNLIRHQLGDRENWSQSARDLADIGRAAVLGLLQYAAIDQEQAHRYEGLVTSLFALLAVGMEHPEMR